MLIVECEYVNTGNDMIAKQVYFVCDRCNERIWTRQTRVLPVNEIEYQNKIQRKWYCSYCKLDILKFEKNARSKAGFLDIDTN